MDDMQVWCPRCGQLVDALSVKNHNCPAKSERKITAGDWVAFLAQRYPEENALSLISWHKVLLEKYGEAELFQAAKDFARKNGDFSAFAPTYPVKLERKPEVGPNLDSREYQNRVSGMMVGMAVGDALGYRDEFLHPQSLLEKYGLLGVCDPQGVNRKGEFLYTDDTQMAVALAEGLLETKDYTNYTGVVKKFVEWLHSPDNNRAPGNACMRGCQQLNMGQVWYKAGDLNSKGAGSVMRVFPVGALYRDNLNAIVVVSDDQAVMTHAHPTGILAAVVGAYVVSLALKDVPPAELLPKTIGFTEKFFNNKEMLAVLRGVERVMQEGLDDYAASDILGSGWVAEEALGIGLLSFLRSPDDFAAVVRRAVNFPGRGGSCDRDTVGAIAGAIAGAYVGLDGILPRWESRIENRGMLLELGRKLAKHSTEYCQHELKPSQSKGIALLTRPF